MNKIRTIFVRDDATKKVKPELDPAINVADLVWSNATEKVDGTNVRLTIRGGSLVRVEARRNPSKAQKAAGIIEPWYRDAWHVTDGYVEASFKYIVEAAQTTVFAGTPPDGEWSAEAIGPRIQGNPLEVPVHTCVVFSHGAERERLQYKEPVYSSQMTGAEFYDAVYDFLKGAESRVSPGHPIEGLVFWRGPVIVGKVKRKDFL